MNNRCWCFVCECEERFSNPLNRRPRVRMNLCPDCGNKRCPKATDHRYECTGSNEPGQKGSLYE